MRITAVALIPIGVPDEELSEELKIMLPERLKSELPPLLAPAAGEPEGSEGMSAPEVTVRQPQRLPERSVNRRRGQYRSDAVMELLVKAGGAQSEESSPYGRAVGLVDADCYARELNFIFGAANPGGPLAFVALPRLRPEFWGQPADEELFFRRVLKEAVHELGHTLDLPHCDNRRCVMYFSNRIADTDYKGAEFCDFCLRKLD